MLEIHPQRPPGLHPRSGARTKVSRGRSILVVQSDPAYLTLVRESLLGEAGSGFDATWMGSCGEALEYLGRVMAPGSGHGRPTAVLVDLCLPDSEGIDTFNRIFHVAPQVPMLVLATAKTEKVARVAVQRGAADYILLSRVNEYLLTKLIGSVVAHAETAEALFSEQERARVTLNSIGDGVVSTGVDGNITYLNPVAEGMTGWSRAEALGRPLEEVVQIVDASSRVRVHDPMALAVLENRVVGLVPNCVLVRRDGAEAAIEDSVAPILDRAGCVAGAVMVLRDVGESRAKSLRHAYQAQHDDLTKLSNRFLLHDRLQQAISMARRHGQKVGVLFLDVDRFKEINDALGPYVGDGLLQSVACRLLESVRDSDTVSRMGGDEFVVLLSEIAKAVDASVCADRILSAIARAHQIDEHELHVTASVGVSVYPDDGGDAEALIRQADAAMYHAKKSGRNNFQFYTQLMGSVASRVENASS
jgi:diguanylate cyclase (GGDEF)-like protein/PAS domain S-box-containing protein